MRADRLLAILMLLQHRGRLTAAEIAVEVEVSLRTVLRDVEALSASGVPVYTDRGRGGGIRLIPGYRTDLTGLTLDEAKALLSSGSGRVASPAFASAMRKVAAALPGPHRVEATRAAQRILVRPDGFAWPRPPEPHLVELQRAVIDGLRVRALYRRPNTETTERTLDPVGLVYAGDHWYLLALREGTERTYRVARIEGLTVLAEAATRPADVDLEAAFLAHWASFRNSLPKVTVACLVHDEAWESLSRTALRTLSREVGSGRWSRAELEFAEDTHAIRALWAAAPTAIALAPQRIRDELAARAAETATTYTARCSPPIDHHPNVGEAPQPDGHGVPQHEEDRERCFVALTDSWCQRYGRSASRRSAVMSSGCSIAAKWPPRGMIASAVGTVACAGGAPQSRAPS